ncbi:protein mono-ADP-ribosyltransferase PARP12-like [Schistocerca americana]|uniref:protein mono-ADP-ribosyltransferase PARP12-like n=1 Tax=Schistocerca americana TaxID=7009 RepID=UPI001F4FA5EC|nr:protein mono-ADP-ribosyltransferase PARP12-like [Schistocerca americana]
MAVILQEHWKCSDTAMEELALRHLPPSWTDTSSNEVEVAVGDISVHMPHDLQVTSVVKVVNPYLWCCYQLKKAEYVNRYGSAKEMTLYHGTSRDNMESIITNNLNWRCSERVRYGQGISFSPSTTYANFYSKYNFDYKWKNRTDMAMIVATVLVNNTAEGNNTNIVPPTGSDTTIGDHYQVYVKHCDNEFYPEYIIYYKIYIDDNF